MYSVHIAACKQKILLNLQNKQRDSVRGDLFWFNEVRARWSVLSGNKIRLNQHSALQHLREGFNY